MAGNSFEIKREISDGVGILIIRGELNYEHSDELIEKSSELCKEGYKNILLDLEKVAHIDSSGVGAIVSSLNLARENGGDLKLLKLSPPIVKVFTFTNLIDVFEIFEDMKEAIDSF